MAITSAELDLLHQRTIVVPGARPTARRHRAADIIERASRRPSTVAAFKGRRSSRSLVRESPYRELHTSLPSSSRDAYWTGGVLAAATVLTVAIHLRAGPQGARLEAARRRRTRPVARTAAGARSGFGRRRAPTARSRLAARRRCARITRRIRRRRSRSGRPALGLLRSTWTTRRPTCLAWADAHGDHVHVAPGRLDASECTSGRAGERVAGGREHARPRAPSGSSVPVRRQASRS